MRETVPRALAGERLDRVVAMLTGLPRGQVATLVDSGEVSLTGRPVTHRSRRVTEGDVLELTVPVAGPRAIPSGDAGVAFEIVHVDDDIVVVDKPAGLVVHPGAGRSGGTLVDGLLARFPDMAGVGPDPRRPGVVHRLDKGTSGLLVVARTPAAYTGLVHQMVKRTVERAYLALVWGHVHAPAGVVDARVGRSEGDRTRMTVAAGGRSARTRYRTRQRFDDPAPSTLVECTLETGRTHQVRVHLAAIGHPVVGDDRYGGGRPALRSGRPFLHAFALALDHPATGQRVRFTSQLPADLEDVRGRLG